MCSLAQGHAHRRCSCNISLQCAHVSHFYNFNLLLSTLSTPGQVFFLKIQADVNLLMFLLLWKELEWDRRRLDDIQPWMEGGEGEQKWAESLPQAERQSLSRSRKTYLLFLLRSPQVLHPPFKKISLFSSESNRRLAWYPLSLSAVVGSEASVSLAEVQPVAQGQAGTCLVPRKASPPENKARGPEVTTERSRTHIVADRTIFRSRYIVWRCLKTPTFHTLSFSGQEVPGSTDTWLRGSLPFAYSLRWSLYPHHWRMCSLRLGFIFNTPR